MTTERVREVLEEDGFSINSTAAATEMPTSCLQRFYSGERGLRLETFFRLCDHLGLELVRRVDFADHCRRVWLKMGHDDRYPEYAKQREEAWQETGGDGDKTRWVFAYDADHYQAWADAAFAEFCDQERQRVDSLGWIILKGTERPATAPAVPRWRKVDRLGKLAYPAGRRHPNY